MQAEISTRGPAVPEFWRTSPPLVGRCREYLGDHSSHLSALRVLVYRSGFHCHARIHGMRRRHARLLRRCFPQERGGLDLESGQYGVGLWGHGLCPAYRLGSGSLLLPAGLIGFGTMPLICAGILWALVSPIRPQRSPGATFGATS
jgi:hypothetical protein